MAVASAAKTNAATVHMPAGARANGSPAADGRPVLAQRGNDPACRHDGQGSDVARPQAPKHAERIRTFGGASGTRQCQEV